ncbi:MAG: M20 family metallopeptidase [Vicinamibacterales bacterium]
MPALLRYCQSQEAWLIDVIEELVRHESPSDDKAAVDACGAAIASLLSGLGARVERLAQPKAGDHLRATFGSGDRQVLLSGHFDTVWPVGQLERMPFELRDGRLHGPGIFDMKAGISIGMLAARAVLDAPPPGWRLVVLLTTDEEVGSTTSRALIEDEARRSDAVLVLEPSLPGGVLKTARKGCGEFEMTITGVPAHAGVDPTKGASAILELAHQVLALHALRDLDRGVSVNTGVVEGGSRPNVVAERSRARIDVRAPTMADAARIEGSIRALRPQVPGTSIEVRGGFERPPLERSAGVAALFSKAHAVAAELGFELREGSTGGGSDGNFTAALGVPTLDGLGAVGDGAHAIHEHVERASLVTRAALVAGLIDRIVSA